MSTNGGQAWEALIRMLHFAKPWMNEQIATFDITPQSAFAMIRLDACGEMMMSEIASELACDASNATGIIDRLAARGLVERRPAPHDRRAKVVRLTPAGQRLQKRIKERMFSAGPPPIASLSTADQRALRDILLRAIANTEESAAEKTG
jgi:DNA-binding MarR family transcriptional regulator